MEDGMSYSLGVGMIIVVVVRESGRTVIIRRKGEKRAVSLR
jgi:hypothetical protein